MRMTGLIQTIRQIGLMGLIRPMLIGLICLIGPMAFAVPANAKIYIDVASPGTRKLPVTVTVHGADVAGRAAAIIKNDLDTTGLFSFVDHTLSGAEIKADIDFKISGEMTAILTINDMVEGREVLKKRFSASTKSIRKVAHSISNDIYSAATGRQGIFTTKLAFLVNTSPGKKDLRLMDWDGYNAFRIVSKGLTASHAWSHDGQHIIYSSERNRKWKIYSMDLKKYSEKVLVSSKGLNMVGGTSAEDLLAFSSSKTGNQELYIISTNGGNAKKITRSFGIDISPVFSPDSSRIAFVSDRGGTPQIYLTGPDGKRPKRLTFEGSYNTSPAWSPNGKQLIFTGRTYGKNQIFMLHFDDKEIQQLTHSGNNESPVFSPDGFFIAFDSDRDGKHGIYIMRTDGMGQKRVTPAHLNATSPEWSPYLK